MSERDGFSKWDVDCELCDMVWTPYGYVNPRPRPSKRPTLSDHWNEYLATLPVAPHPKGAE